MTTGAWRAWMGSLTESEGMATAADLTAVEALEDDDRRLLSMLLDGATSALAAEDAALRSAFAHPRWELTRLPPERRGARGLSYWVFEQVLVYTVFKEWARAAPVVWDEVEPGGRRRPDLLVLDDAWQRPRFVFEAKWWTEGQRGIVLDARKLAERASGGGGGAPFLLTFFYGRRSELEIGLREAVLPEGVVPVHVGCFPCEIYTRWSPPAWREAGCFTVATFHVGP